MHLPYVFKFHIYYVDSEDELRYNLGEVKLYIHYNVCVHSLSMGKHTNVKMNFTEVYGKDRTID